MSAGVGASSALGGDASAAAPVLFSHKRHGAVQARGNQLLRCCLPCWAGPWPLLGLVVLGSCGSTGLVVGSQV